MIKPIAYYLPQFHPTPEMGHNFVSLTSVTITNS